MKGKKSKPKRDLCLHCASLARRQKVRPLWTCRFCGKQACDHLAAYKSPALKRATCPACCWRMSK